MAEITDSVFIDDIVKVIKDFSDLHNRICLELCKHRDVACRSGRKEDIRDTICKDCFMYIEVRDRKKEEKSNA